MHLNVTHIKLLYPADKICKYDRFALVEVTFFDIKMTYARVTEAFDFMWWFNDPGRCFKSIVSNF